jgi:lysophospholipase L1-like esterase
MTCFRCSRYLSLLAVSVALVWTTALTAQDKAPEKKNSAATPESRPDAKGWTDRHEAMNARVKQGNVDLIFIGDSITHGWESGGKKVWEKFYAQRNAVNLGISGDRTQHVLWRLDHGNIDGISPKLAVVMIGTNNTSQNTPEEIVDGIKAIVERLRTKLPETKVLLMAIFPRGPNNDDPRRQVAMKVNEALPNLADGRIVQYIDIAPMLLAADGTLAKPIMSDLLHPTAKGYAIWAEAIEATVTTMMGERENPEMPVPLEPGRWLQRHEAINARVKQGNVDLIFVGDSITEGWENEGKNAWDKFYGNRNAVNLGISRDRTQHVLWRLDHGNIDGISPKLAVVMIGTNNSSRSAPEQIPEGIKAIVDKLRDKLPETKILLLGIFPRGRNATDRLRQVNEKVNETIAKLADNKAVFYLDIGYRFVGADGAIVEGLTTDRLHPNAAGYEAWAESIEPVVAKLMGEKENAAIPLPRDAKWVQRAEALSNRVKQGRANLLFIGDSITEGWEGAGREVWAKHYDRRNAVNLGISGDKTQHVLWRLNHGNIDGIAPRLAVVMIGTNNIGANAADDSKRDTPEEIAAGVKAIVEKLREKLPRTGILLVGIFPRGADKDSHLRQLTTQTNELIAKLADNNRGVFYIDIGPKFLTADGTLTKEVMPDLLHLTPASYGIWAESIEQMVAELMGEKP